VNANNPTYSDICCITRDIALEKFSLVEVTFKSHLQRQWLHMILISDSQ